MSVVCEIFGIVRACTTLTNHGDGTPVTALREADESDGDGVFGAGLAAAEPERGVLAVLIVTESEPGVEGGVKPLFRRKRFANA